MDTFIAYSLGVLLLIPLSSQMPCPKEGCANTTFYVGRTWESKIQFYPPDTKSQDVSDQEATRLDKQIGDVRNTRVKVVFAPDSLEYEHRKMKGSLSSIGQELMSSFQDESLEENNIQGHFFNRTILRPSYNNLSDVSGTPYKDFSRHYVSSRKYYYGTGRPYNLSKILNYSTERPSYLNDRTNNTFGKSYTISKQPLNDQDRGHNLFRRPSHNTERPFENRGTLHKRFGNPYYNTRRPYGLYPPTNRSTTYIIINQGMDSNNMNTSLDLTGLYLTGIDLVPLLSSANNSNRVCQLLLGHNAINTLPERVFPLELEYTLHELHLDNNPLGAVNGQTAIEISRLRSLKVLNLSRTDLFYLAPLYIPTLSILDLSGNVLYSVPARLENLQSLQELNLSGNRIFMLMDTSIGSLTNLQILHLEGNGLTYLGNDTFQQLKNLKVLYMNNNSLSSSSQLWKIHFSAFLFLGHNPWPCQCDWISFAQSSWPSVADMSDFTCVDHDGLQRNMSSLTYEDIQQFCSGGADMWQEIRITGNRLAQWLNHNMGSHNTFFLQQVLFLLYIVLQGYCVVLVVRGARRLRTGTDTTRVSLIEEEYKQQA